MKTTKKILSVVLACVMLFSMCAVCSVHAAARLTDIKIISVPDKLTFYKGVDWDYGEWNQPGEGEWEWYPSNRISFLRNPGGGCFPDAGMIDAGGLVIEASYSDGSKKTIEYKETKSSSGEMKQNINLSPEKGFYRVGKMEVEVWLEEDYYIYDTYEIELSESAPPPPRLLGDINDDTEVDSADALLLLQHSVNLITLTDSQKAYADMNEDEKYNSSDALLILQKAVGM